MLYRVYVFEAKGERSHPLKFISAFIVAYSANMLVLTEMLAIRPDLPYLAQVLASVAYLAVMFTMSKLWVFRQRNRVT